MLKRKIALVMFAAVVLFFLVNLGSLVAWKGDSVDAIAPTESSVELTTKMRRLFEDNTVYNRNLIISSLSDIDDVEDIVQRLLENQDNLGETVIKYYGRGGGRKVAKLFKNNVLIAKDVFKAAKARDDVALAEATGRWSGSADDIASALSRANPAWPRQTLKDILYKHQNFSTAQVVARLNQDWQADLEAYDQDHDCVLLLADTLSDGIVRQFPRKFRE